MRVAAIVPAAGIGKRLKSATPKSLVRIFGKPLLAYALANLKKSFSFEEIIAAVPPRQSASVRRLLRRYSLKGVRLVPGGKTRAESVKNALASVSGRCDWVLVHDAARPMVSPPLVRRLLREAARTGAAISAVPVSSTVKRVNTRTGTVLGTIDRRTVYLAQTPQVFRKSWLVGQYDRLGARALRLTDEASFFEGSGVRVKAVMGDPRNIKITTLEDIKLFKFFLKCA